MIDYTLKIDSLEIAAEINGHPDTVTRAIWTMTGTDGDLTATTSSSTEFPQPPEGGAFISFSDLTEATVIGWVEDNTDPDYLDSRQAIIETEIEALRNPHVPPKPPWIA